MKLDELADQQDYVDKLSRAAEALQADFAVGLAAINATLTSTPRPRIATHVWAPSIGMNGLHFGISNWNDTPCIQASVDGTGAASWLSTIPATVVWDRQHQQWLTTLHNHFGPTYGGPTLETLSDRPRVPLIVGSPPNCRYLWWDGPSDNQKIASAILDAFTNTYGSSDFSFPAVRTATGCSLAIAATSVFVATLIIWFVLPH